jgi:hypothetical protein
LPTMRLGYELLKLKKRTKRFGFHCCYGPKHVKGFIVW